MQALVASSSFQRADERRWDISPLSTVPSSAVYASLPRCIDLQQKTSLCVLICKVRHSQRRTHTWSITGSVVHHSNFALFDEQRPVPESSLKFCPICLNDRRIAGSLLSNSISLWSLILNSKPSWTTIRRTEDGQSESSTDSGKPHKPAANHHHKAQEILWHEVGQLSSHPGTLTPGYEHH